MADRRWIRAGDHITLARSILDTARDRGECLKPTRFGLQLAKDRHAVKHEALQSVGSLEELVRVRVSRRIAESLEHMRSDIGEPESMLGHSAYAQTNLPSQS